ncbi:Mitochondrial DNA polymerase catalytic subunit [Saitozyma sp. JCM 24511]|nr:Mitochondrial DNA polymerase catalytic subunit [Saitozyma sp. JCM 24511]
MDKDVVPEGDATAGTSSARDENLVVTNTSRRKLDPSGFNFRLTIEATERRRNPVGVQLLSSKLHSQLFPGSPQPKPPVPLLDISKSHLAAHGLSPEGAAVLPEIAFDMPPIHGRNIREHFLSLGQNTAEPYLSMAKELMASDLPSFPEAWETAQPGWTRYNKDGSREAVEDLGDERIVSFDVETLYKLSPYPVMATAASPDAWYSWLSPTLFEQPPASTPPASLPWETRTADHHPNDLIPLFHGSAPRLVIGHNVGYDRARVLEEYDLGGTSTRWLDTLSLHVATRGITSVQRPAWMKHRKSKLEKIVRDTESLAFLQEEAETNGDAALLESLQAAGETADAELEALQKRWEDVCSVNSLAEVAALHCGIPVDKSIRNRFADESITHASQLRPELQALLAYCANDVRTTHDVYRKVLPLFLESCPHPASFAGVLSMGSSFLPVNESWEAYLRNAESKYREMDEGVRKALRILADKLRKEGSKEGDSWASQLDWTPKAARWPEGGPEAEAPTDGQSSIPATTQDTAPLDNRPIEPAWYSALASDRSSIVSTRSQRYLLPLLLRMSYKTHPVAFLSEHYWCFKVPQDLIPDYIDAHGPPVELGPKDIHLYRFQDEYGFFRIPKSEAPRRVKLCGSSIKKEVKDGLITSPYPQLLEGVTKASVEGLEDDLWKCAEDLKMLGTDNDWGAQLEWSLSSSGASYFVCVKPATDAACAESSSSAASSPSSSRSRSRSRTNHGSWPKWYHDLTCAPTNDKVRFGELDLTIKKTVAPLLLRLQWQGHPLIFSREHKWLYRVPKAEALQQSKSHRGESVKFDANFKGDEVLKADDRHVYFRLPHKDGEGKNVGNPLSKSFVKAIESGELASAAAEGGDDVARQAAADATNMNVLCSYWISSRERIMDQMVVYRDPSFGMILPQVITMGTVTRRAVEATWLTASNAKKNRVGSELKAMVRAPPGYSIVGADVDSEELWISSVMGDSQFGMHGATAIGWMTLEGTKSAGTDLHSKTASILGISRDAAKVFNYSRIYGAGQKHAVQLLMQGDATLSKEKAELLAADLYKETKGSKSTRSKKLFPAQVHSLWHGGSESYLFNTLEAIALSDRPTTPALGCGVTKALRRSYLEEGSSYLPSRINWVVQSSGVDYLHLLIVSMEYLIRKYDIQARYLISVHDEVRYLAKEEDRYRTALALQIANAWTRALFCYNLGIDDMPQGIAFFSAVDVDFVLRKEVFMTCETPSHPTPIPAGESLDIDAVLEKTGGSLGLPNENIFPMVATADTGPPVKLFPDIASTDHRRYLDVQAQKSGAACSRWLNAQPPLIDYEGEVAYDLPAKPKSARIARPKSSRTKKAGGGELASSVDDYAAGDDVGVDWEAVLSEVPAPRRSGADQVGVRKGRKVAVVSSSKTRTKSPQRKE